MFKTVSLDEDESILIDNLEKLNYTHKLNKDKIKRLINENIIFSKEQFLNNYSKQKDGLDGIISFSRVSFNEQHDKAAIFVGIFRSRLDSNLKVYLLEKSKGKWKIKSYKTLEVS